MPITDYFDDLNGKIPYINPFENLYCTFDEKQEIQCTNTFREKGYFKNLVWDRAAKYRDMCNRCKYFKHDIGFYFGEGRYSDRFEEKTAFHILVQTPGELEEVVLRMPHARRILIESGRNFRFSALEKLQNIESVQLFPDSKDTLWDMRKTPKLRLLEIEMGKMPPNLDALSQATGLQYLCMSVHTSQVNSTVLSSFDFFKGLTNLSVLVLAGVTSAEKSMDELIELPKLERLWISPNLFAMEEYAKFEAKKFKIFQEYGIFTNGDYVCPFGVKARAFRSEIGKERFVSEYREIMKQYA